MIISIISKLTRKIKNYFKKYFNSIVNSFATHSNNKTVLSILKVTSGNSIAALIGVIGTIVQARLVGPTDLGYLKQFGIITYYAFFLHLGLWHALQRLYPLYLGAGENDKANKVAEICQSWILSISFIISLFFFFFSIGEAIKGNWKASLAWDVQIVTIIYSFYGGYLNATYRSSNHFTKAVKSSIISNITSLFALPFFLISPYIGMVLRNTIGSIASLFYLNKHRPLKIKFRFNFKEWLNLLNEGLPLFTASYIVGMGWTALESTLVLSYFNTYTLGLWSICIMIIELLKIVPQTMVSIYIPSLTFQFGQSNSLKDTLNYCFKPLIWGFFGMIILISLIYFPLPYILTFFAPKYNAAIPMINLMLFLLPLLILEIPLTLLIAKGKLLAQNVASLCGIISFACINLVFFKFNIGINGLILASLLGRLVRIFVSYTFIYFALREENVL